MAAGPGKRRLSAGWFRAEKENARRNAPYIPQWALDRATPEFREKFKENVAASTLPPTIKSWLAKQAKAKRMFPALLNAYFRGLQRMRPRETRNGRFGVLSPGAFLRREYEWHGRDTKLKLKPRHNVETGDKSVRVREIRGRGAMANAAKLDAFLRYADSLPIKERYKDELKEFVRKRISLSEFDAHRMSHYFIGLEILDQIEAAQRKKRGGKA